MVTYKKDAWNAMSAKIVGASGMEAAKSRRMSWVLVRYKALRIGPLYCYA